LIWLALIETSSAGPDQLIRSADRIKSFQPQIDTDETRISFAAKKHRRRELIYTEGNQGNEEFPFVPSVIFCWFLQAHGAGNVLNLNAHCRQILKMPICVVHLPFTCPNGAQSNWPEPFLAPLAV